MLTLKNFLRCELEKQRVDLFYWLPVALASGIGCYLSLRQEPAPNLLVAIALLGGVFSGLSFSNMQLCAIFPFVGTVFRSARFKFAEYCSGSFGDMAWRQKNVSSLRF